MVFVLSFLSPGLDVLDANPTETYDFTLKWGTQGSGDGQFNTPYGIAIDSSGDVYVADYLNNRVQKFIVLECFY